MLDATPTFGLHPFTPSKVYIRTFQPSDALAFRSLNEEWIVRYFALEERDRQVLGDPQTHILQSGGHIFMACLDSLPVGCCALIPFSPGVFELTKMAVAPDLRGRGVGRKLLSYTIEQARTFGATCLFLGSSTKLTSAVRLYESCGFRHLCPHEIPPLPYQRASVFMALHL